LKFKKLVYFRLTFYRHFFLGFVIPFLFFLFYLQINDLIPFYLKQLQLPFIINNMRGTDAIIITFTTFIALINHAIREFFPNHIGFFLF